MVFRRRDNRPIWQVATEFVWPKGGWKRAATYILHRLRRLPDTPERIARGFFAGVFISFTPLFGLHFVGAALIAWAYRGNIVAALLGTFVGNPLTTPIFMTMSLETGYWLLGTENRLTLSQIMPFFTEAAAQISRNLMGFWTGGPMNWEHLSQFFTRIWWPLLVGSVLPGTAFGLAFQWGSLPLIRAYQRLRRRRAEERASRRKQPPPRGQT